MLSKRIFLLLCVLFFNLCQVNLGFTADLDVAKKQTLNTAFEVNSEKSRSRTFLLPPLASFIMPGFDQWWEGQTLYGAAYSGVSLFGLGLATADLSPKLNSDSLRLKFLGLQLYQTAGSMSAYHSFRTAVKTRQPNGDFLFLKHEETPTELLTAPFDFSYLSRPTTYLGIPANLLVGILLAKLQGFSGSSSNSWHMPGATDVFFSGTFSYNAGVGEEALFRGWMMPVAMHYTNSEVASNVLTSLVFGAAHYNSANPNYIPYSQTIAGFYLGYLAQRNEWKLGESIFVHTWYDVIAFLLSYATADSDAKSKATFQLSPFTIPF